MFYSFQAKTLLYVIQTTEGRKNLVYIHFTLSRFFANALNDKCFRLFSSPKLVQNPFFKFHHFKPIHVRFGFLRARMHPQSGYIHGFIPKIRRFWTKKATFVHIKIKNVQRKRIYLPKYLVKLINVCTFALEKQ